jgi:hypothetical protein
MIETQGVALGWELRHPFGVKKSAWSKAAFKYSNFDFRLAFKAF